MVVKAFLIFTGILLIPPNEMAIFFGGSENEGFGMDVRHAWITLIFTGNGQSAMLEGAKAMELELAASSDAPDVTALMVETLRKGELGRLLHYALAVLPEPTWVTAAQRRSCRLNKNYGASNLCLPKNGWMRCAPNILS